MKQVNVFDISQAKKNCKKCHGRGIVGNLWGPKTNERTPVLCKCLPKIAQNIEPEIDYANKQLSLEEHWQHAKATVEVHAEKQKETEDKIEEVLDEAQLILATLWCIALLFEAKFETKSNG